MQDTKRAYRFGAMQFKRTYRGDIVPDAKPSKYHLFHREGDDRSKTLCGWDFYITDHKVIRSERVTDIDYEYAKNPDAFCSICYNSYLVKTGGEVKKELKLEGDCACRLIQVTSLHKKILMIQYCQKHEPKEVV